MPNLNNNKQERNYVNSVKKIFDILIRKAQFNRSDNGTVVSIQSTTRCTVRMLDSDQDRTNVYIPPQVNNAGIAVNDYVRVEYENNQASEMSYKI